MTLDEFMESVNANIVEAIRENPELAAKEITDLRTEVGQLLARIEGLNELIDVLILGRGMTAEEFKETFPSAITH